MALTTPGLIWLIIGVVCFLLEMAVPGFIIFFFGVGAWVTSIACWLFPLGLNSQLVIFLVSSLVALFALRGFIQRTFLGSSTSGEESHGLAQAGETAEVIGVIVPPAEGKVQYSGTQWRAVAEEEIPVGEIVTILSQDGLLMHVKRKV